jgi:hypothetical protein
MADKEVLKGHAEAQEEKLAQATERRDYKAVALHAKNLEQIYRDIGVEPERKEEGGGGGGGTGAGDVIAGQKEQDQLAEMFDKLSPAELYRLYDEDRPTWQKIMDAKERAGWKRLFGF